MSRAAPEQEPKADPTGSAFGASAPIILIRHGETEWSRSGQHTGRTDLPLTELGHSQASSSGQIVRRLLNGLSPSAVISSPRLRARTTAELAGFAPTEINADATEWDYGDYEGLTSSQIRAVNPDWLLWDGIVPGGEDSAAITVRIDRLLSHAEELSRTGPVLIFSHGHASRCMAARWIGEPVSAGRHYRLGTGAVSVLDHDHADPAILYWNLDEFVLNAPTAGT